MKKRYTDIEQAETAAVEASVQNPNKYVTLFNCFGLEVEIKSRLALHAPSDCFGDFYWRNGKKRPFTKAQKDRDARFQSWG
jgi:hypothetical protein